MYPGEYVEIGRYCPSDSTTSPIPLETDRAEQA
jgi:hypothetical protein